MAQLSRKLRAAPSNSGTCWKAAAQVTCLSEQNPRICDADAVQWDMSQQDFSKLEQSSGKAPRPRTKRARSRTSFLKEQQGTSTRWTQLLSSTPTIGGSNVLQPSIAPFCGWRFMR